MENKVRVLSLAFILVFMPVGPVVHGQRQANEGEQVTKIRSEIAKRVIKKQTRVKIKLQNGAELKGRIDQADETRFTVADEKTGKQIEIAYGEVAGVKGRGLGKGAKIGIIAAVVVGVVVIAAAVSFHNFDPFEHGLILR